MSFMDLVGEGHEMSFGYDGPPGLDYREPVAAIQAN
jgi:hypothetical protein